jgi:hypothetical protein
VPALQRRAADAVEALRAAGAELRAFADALAPHVARFCAGLAAKPQKVDRLALHHHEPGGGSGPRKAASPSFRSAT